MTDNNTALITIVIPVYNVQRYIRDCISSVMQQEEDRIECLIVDDGGTDDSMHVVADILSEYHGAKRFRVLTQPENRGAAAARNRGIREAAGDYIFFLDSDDRLLPSSISILAGYLSRYPGIDMVHGDMTCEDKAMEKELSIDNDLFPVFTDDQNWLKDNFFLHVPITPCNKLVKKELLCANSLWFKEGIVCEDVLWAFHLRTYIKRIAFCKEKTYYYRYNDNSVMTAPANEIKRISSYSYVLVEMLKGIKDNMRNIDNLCILKHFQHNRMLTISDGNRAFFEREYRYAIRMALQSSKVLWGCKPMYLLLRLPKSVFAKLLFLWNKGLGILYRLR